MKSIVALYDWDALEAHYAEYSETERAEICNLSKCPKCTKLSACTVAKKESYRDFVAQLPA